ncbi:S2P endopeptidase [Malassezia vespertilionis]|uniref:Endopeptidase S2P n=1 Tax=Malassezia vespertilionis TaxID=2020962 RepID=A0A2N1J9C1_9BASI|nr:S2P endopeptidase [Malassezia vespertilionis]PKI83134.1 hypothetical protein MVES_002886 [Malassezia vespertilionis]WFD07675.1 S2P endopeptidase [Malassezia vespertilionis]
MATSPVLLLLSGVWIVAFVLHRYVGLREIAGRWWARKACTANLYPFRFTVETQAWNAWPQKTLAHATRSGVPVHIVRAFYWIGVYFAAALLCGVLLLMGGVCVQLWAHFFAPQPAALVRRSQVQATPPTWIVPLVRIFMKLMQIPGVTLPGVQIAPLFFAVLASQVAHEAGHALVAALYRIKPQSMGLTILYPFLPIAHVALAGTGRLTRKSQLCIVAAGVWHNACIWTCLALFMQLPLSNIVWTDANGLLITHAAGSARGWAQRGAVITRIDDWNLASAAPESRFRAWDALLRDEAKDVAGWCVGAQVWLTAPSQCCLCRDSKQVCFAGEGDACLDPLTVFLTTTPRCTASKACDAHHVCVHAAANESIARVTVLAQRDSAEFVLRGPFSELSGEVRLSAHVVQPWIRVWGRAMERIVTLFSSIVGNTFRALLLVNATLCLVNMLPIFGFDGAVYVRILLVAWYARGYDDVPDTFTGEDDIEEQDTQHRALVSKVENTMGAIQAVTSGLALVAFGGSTLLAFT